MTFIFLNVILSVLLAVNNNLSNESTINLNEKDLTMTKDEKEKALKLKTRLTKAGIGINDVTDRIQWPYSTVYSQLSGYTPLTPTIERLAEKMIKEVSK